MSVSIEKQQAAAADQHPDIEAARLALAVEGEGLAALAASLGSEFLAALDLLEAASGRVIVTGMGKSGHVAAKIAATLASTGSPALFVHPAEASHGDLGMITPQDAVIALSNSGNTPELGDIVAYSRRFAIPLIAVVGRSPSVLAEAADRVLLLPDVREACPMGLAPTTSTTMMLALGDALAIALLRRRGFSVADFQVFHPGGSLGRKLIKVEDIMHLGEELPLCGPETEMSEAILIMTAKRFGCVGVVEGKDRLVGIITDGDLRRHMQGGLLGLSAGEIMTRGPKTIRPQALAAEALHSMNEGARRVTSLFVVEEGRAIGILHIHDLLRAGVA